jgi:Cof subfamily protein (haloacid dehalogenase superfamily)
MAIELLALDLDGTLVNQALQLSPRTCAAIAAVQSQTNVRVMVATGRMFPSALPFVQQLGLTTPVVVYQGAMTRAWPSAEANGDLRAYPLLDHRPIPLGLAQDVLAFLDQHGYHTNVYIHDVLYIRPSNPFAETYKQVSGVAPTVVDDLPGHLTAPPSKLMVITPDGAMPALIDGLRQRYGTRLNVCASRHNFCELIDTTASKWAAIWQLAQTWGIPADNIMAIGDQDNDRSMLEAAGLGVAMGNAPAFIQALANVVTDTIDNDGAAQAIERYILRRGKAE